MKAAVIRHLFVLTHGTIKRNLAEMTHADSLIAPVPAGNCANWVLGHGVATRNRVHEILGAPPPLSGKAAARYLRRSPPLTDPAEAVMLEDLISALDASQEVLLAAIDRAGDAGLEERVGDSTLGGSLAFFQFHEAYHSGQLGLLRRIAGHPGAI
jgi:hypothetical protein